MKRLIIALIGLMACAGAASGARAEETRAARPNVLFLLTDDQRPDTIAALGNKRIRTPHLDRLVREGTTFTRAITAIPICVASRAEIMTGRDGLKNGRKDFGFSPATDATHWAEAMRDAGYETCYVGKWHTPGRPSDHGWMRTEELYAGGGGQHPLTFPKDWYGRDVTGYRGWVAQTIDGRTFPERGVGLTPDISSRFADGAIRFMKEPREKPFFLHVNFTAPHDPLLAPPGEEWAYDPDEMPLPRNFAKEHPFDHGNFKGRDELLFRWPRTPEETRGELAVYYAVLSHLDAQVGRILKSLEETKQLDRTLVVFSSDHGLAIGSHGLRGKQNLYEHSVGVPLIVRGPGIPRGRRTSAGCYLRDLFPTVCDLCDVPTPAALDGVSLKPVLDGTRERAHDALFASFRDTQFMIRADQWKYIDYPQAQREQLFDLSNDPDELDNLAANPRFQSTKDALRTRLTAWREARRPR